MAVSSKWARSASGTKTGCGPGIPAGCTRPFDLAAVVVEDPALVTGMFDDLLRVFEEGRLRPLPSTVFPLVEAEEAFRFMAQAKHIGKIVLSREEEYRREVIEAHGLVRPDAAYLVTGGLGALGLRVAGWLVAEGARHVVLTGRRGPDEAAQRALAELEAQGATVTVVAADVASGGGCRSHPGHHLGGSPAVARHHPCRRGARRRR